MSPSGNVRQIDQAAHGAGLSRLPGSTDFGDLFRALQSQGAPPDPGNRRAANANAAAAFDKYDAAHQTRAFEIARRNGYTAAETARRLGVEEAEVNAWLERNGKSLATAPAVPDLSNDAWIHKTTETREALDQYVRSVVEGPGTVVDKYKTLKDTLPADMFRSSRTGWLNRALPGNNAQAADDLIRAIDPYCTDRWIDPSTEARMNSLSASAFPEAVRVGYDSSGQVYDLDTATDVAPGAYRDISNDWAREIIAGEAPIMHPPTALGCGDPEGENYAEAPSVEADQGTDAADGPTRLQDLLVRKIEQFVAEKLGDPSLAKLIGRV
jgi:hypothetical protein